MKGMEQVLAEAAGELPARRPDDGLVAERAEREGLLEVAYAPFDSPLGRLTVAATPRGLVTVAYTGPGEEDAILERLAAGISPRVLEAPGRVDDVRRQLDEYFEGARHDFDVEIDWSLTRGFFRRVLEATWAIGYGSVKSYAEVAASAGSPRAVRATGNALGSNPMPVVVPCHRVLRTGGKLGGYTGGLERKEFLLRLEGVQV